MCDKHIVLKECPKHSLTEFVWYKSEHRYRCKKCLSESVQRKRYRIKEKSVEYKGGKCQICGYNKCIDALEFHHLDPTQKDFGIGSKGYTRSWNKVKQELDKCICVCANCHREIHSEENKNKKLKVLQIHNHTNKYDMYNDDIIKLRNEGLSYYQIAKKLNLNRSTVIRHYKKFSNILK